MLDERGQTNSRRRTGATIGVFDIGARALGKLLEEKSTLQTLLLDLPLQPRKTNACGIVGFLDFDHALLELHTLSTVCLLDGGR